MKKNRFMWAVGVCLMAFSLTFLAGCDSREDTAEMPNFPSNTSVRVTLKPQKDGEAIRYDFYSDDKKTKLHTQIEFVDGVTSFLTYRPDATVAQLEEFYPAKKAGERRQLKRVIVFAADGINYLSDKAWRPDGTRNYIGERLHDGNYELRYFFEDGVLTSKHRLIDADKILISEEILRADGTVEKETKVVGDTLSVTTYSPARTRLSHATYKGSEGEATYYFEDGETVRMTVKSRSWMIDQKSFDRKGNIVELREYTYSQMNVTVYKDGVAQFKQYWSVDFPASKAAGKRIYKLSTLEELRANGTVQRKVEFTNGKPTRAVYPVEGKYWAGKSVSIRDDGTTSEVVVRDDNSKIVSKKEYSDKDGVREKFDTKRFEQAPYEEAPGVNELKTMPYRGYDYY